MQRLLLCCLACRAAGIHVPVPPRHHTKEARLLEAAGTAGVQDQKSLNDNVVANPIKHAFLDKAHGYISQGPAIDEADWEPVDEAPIEVVWQRPDYTHRTPGLDVKGILLLLPGSQHVATDMVKEGELEICKTYKQKCRGLPEQLRLRQMALEAGYVVVSVSSATGAFGRWGPMGVRDFNRIQFALQYVREVENVHDWKYIDQEDKAHDTLPVIATGFREGAEFLGEVASKRLEGLTCIAPIASGVVVPKGKKYPGNIPAFFVHGVRDEKQASEVLKSNCMLDMAGARTVTAQMTRQNITEEFLVRSGFGLRHNDARAVVHALRGIKLIGPDGDFIGDLKTSGWQDAISDELKKSIGGVGEDTSKVSALLKLAYGEDREFTSDFTSAMLDFCAKQKEMEAEPLGLLAYGSGKPDKTDKKDKKEKRGKYGEKNEKTGDGWTQKTCEQVAHREASKLLPKAKAQETWEDPFVKKVLKHTSKH